MILKVQHKYGVYMSTNFTSFNIDKDEVTVFNFFAGEEYAHGVKDVTNIFILDDRGDTLERIIPHFGPVEDLPFTSSKYNPVE